jgi:hypothetical protein
MTVLVEALYAEPLLFEGRDLYCGVPRLQGSLKTDVASINCIDPKEVRSMLRFKLNRACSPR